MADREFELREPGAGELNRRILVRRRADLPSADMGIESHFIEQRYRWAKIVPVGTAVYTGSVQTDARVTHWVILRYVGELTTDYEVLRGEVVYRVKRCTAMNGEHRFSVLEVEELGQQVYSGGLYA